jgi:uncharacterized protein YbcI
VGVFVPARGVTVGAVSFEPGHASLTRGEIASEISNRFVQLLKEHADRGPTKCRTYIDDDHVIVLMRGGFSRLENTLFEDGKWLDVRATRHALQDTMQGRFTEVIERLTGRQVAAFMSASHQRPDLQMEIFILDGGPDVERSVGLPE